MQLRIGARVECRDGPCGVLSRLVVDPRTCRVTHLVVEPPRRHGLARLVPVERARAAGEGIDLDCTEATYQAYPFVEETEFVEVPPEMLPAGPGNALAWPYLGPDELQVPVSRDRLPPGEVELRRNQVVHASDGSAGRVRALVVDPDDRITHVILGQGHLWRERHVAIPADAIEGVDGEGVQLRLSRHDIERLPAVELPPGRA